MARSQDDEEEEAKKGREREKFTRLGGLSYYVCVSDEKGRGHAAVWAFPRRDGRHEGEGPVLSLGGVCAGVVEVVVVVVGTAEGGREKGDRGLPEHVKTRMLVAGGTWELGYLGCRVVCAPGGGACV